MNVRIKLTSQSLCEGMEITHPKHLSIWDFPGGPVFENLLCDAEDTGLIPGQGFSKIYCECQNQIDPAELGNEITCPKHLSIWDFPDGPVVENLPCNAENTGLIPGQETKIPHGQVQPEILSATTKSRCSQVSIYLKQ